MPIDISNFVRDYGGELVGKIRLQKVVYLLDQLGLNSGFSFSYHYYGPFSRELADQVEFDVALGELNLEVRYRHSDGAPYEVYKSPSEASVAQGSRLLSEDKLVSAVRELEDNSSTVLELAATMHWLSEVEEVEDWKKELKQRKGIKLEGGRFEKAFKLLKALDLPPASAS